MAASEGVRERNTCFAEHLGGQRFMGCHRMARHGILLSETGHDALSWLSQKPTEDATHRPAKRASPLCEQSVSSFDNWSNPMPDVRLSPAPGKRSIATQALSSTCRHRRSSDDQPTEIPNCFSATTGPDDPAMYRRSHEPRMPQGQTDLDVSTNSHQGFNFMFCASRDQEVIPKNFG